MNEEERFDTAGRSGSVHYQRAGRAFGQAPRLPGASPVRLNSREAP